ncbi:Coenzyme F420-reducing hydrogenase, beta subunit [Lutibacter agarilyticus]|uniref:Coenzyme F420-reducing hydrogenase, beta subunit n=1 Tax=Lutibacter agarilyticus TaxID=1109740 RepID=A0A238WU37_9FLAO|nr:Coenzyme F420 hydrogenase/dehydrogenase, beta subunit C-terminal domain [Lutibacter agarilyticus]SNR49938.1 Coenzyme F420-reducing hydrogenase, beta subunit [Lutibacter agarilyticus]
MIKIPKVIDLVVKNDLCIGCGVCVYQCPSNALEMKWNDKGFLIPEISGVCDSDGGCLDVCPFNPIPKKEVTTEDDLADVYLNDATKHHSKIGKYLGIYAGYSNQYRLTSSSGGLATYVFIKLLEENIVDYVFSVKDSTKVGVNYEYSIASTKEELLNASKTRYFPVTLATVLPKINELKGKVAIVGVGCFIKAIRLAQHKNPSLREKIPFLIGIICGGVKSRFFTEYLSGKIDVELENIRKPEFRIKDLNSTASDYSFGCLDEDDGKEKTIKMREVGDMWGTGMFKANACDFCDDVTTELADISIGDAWIHPFNKDGRGTNVLISRTNLSEIIIQDGIKKGDVTIENISLENILMSQQGSFNHRHTALKYRVKRAKKRGFLVPPKRHSNYNITNDFKLVQRYRMKVRSFSLYIWAKNKNSLAFDAAIKRKLSILGYLTYLYQRKKRIIKRIQRK